MDPGLILRLDPAQAAELDIARQPVELRDDHGALGGSRGSKGRSQLGPPVERIGAFAGFSFDVLGD